MKYFFALITLVFLAAGASAQDCSLMKKGTFKYVDLESDSTAYFVIDGKTHREYLRNGKYYIESSLKWISDCTYVLVMKKCTVPDFPFKKGTRMTVTVESVEGNKIFFNSIVNGEASEGYAMKQD